MFYVPCAEAKRRICKLLNGSEYERHGGMVFLILQKSVAGTELPFFGDNWILKGRQSRLVYICRAPAGQDSLVVFWCSIYECAYSIRLASGGAYSAALSLLHLASDSRQS